MTIAAKANEDGSVTLTKDGVSIEMHDYDVPTILDACAHADVKHLTWALSALVRQGRTAVDNAWKMVTGLKVAVDGEHPTEPVTPDVVAQAQAALNPPVAEAPAQEAAPAVEPQA